ncbi:MAG: hypothetical protein MUF48_16925 [Pirellulaceae bacterium]|jgi:hypothetical protein|nr:hypothetical protein [Pirellulaceae bacterium]
MQTSIDVPQAFSVRDENEFYPIRHLMSRLNPRLAVTRVSTGRHIHGGPTVVWGVVHVNEQPPTAQDVEIALRTAGYDFEHNGPVQSALMWGAESQ